MKCTDEGVVILCIYVDDACLFGPKRSVLEAKEAIAKLFKVKDVGALQEYVGVTVERPSKDDILISQPDITARLERYFGNEVAKLKEYQTPLPQSFHIVRPEDGSATLNKSDMLKYRSRTGSAVYGNS